MRIVEVSAERIILEIRSRGATLWLLAAMLVWTPFWILPPVLMGRTLFVQGAASPRLWAVLICFVSLALAGFGLWVILRCLRELMFRTTRRLEFDLTRERLTLAERGLRRAADRSFNLSLVRVSAITRTGEDETWQTLSVSAQSGQDGAEWIEIWDTSLSSPHLAPGQRHDLEPLFARLAA